MTLRGRLHRRSPNSSDAAIVVHSYTDEPLGHGESEPTRAGRFLGVRLRPRIEVETGADLNKAEAIHSPPDFLRPASSNGGCATAKDECRPNLVGDCCRLVPKTGR